MILYFSGCGNSRMIAVKLGELLGDQTVIRLTGRSIASGKCFTADGQPASAGRRVVWVMPIYSWGIPPVVARFIKRAEIAGANAAVHHLVLTYGDDAGVAHKQWRRLLARKGWPTRSVSGVTMPNTYTLMKGFDTDPADLAARKLRDAETRVKAIADRIAANVADADLVTGKFAWLKTNVVYPYFKRFCMSPKPFHALDSCISCGRCAAACPMNNIQMTATSATTAKRPQWGKDCALCLACYHVCPTHSVAYGNATASKGQYLNPTANN